jgi:hypothetical protein
MKIDEILVESVQLDEGPFGSIAKAAGTNLGKAVGGVAKGVGAVAGGVAGIGKAVKKGYQTGKAVVGGDDEEPDQSQPAVTSAPNAQQINQQGPKGSALAKQQTGAAAQAMNKTAQATANQTPDQAGQTMYAQVKSQINQLDKKGKQRILALLQKSLGQPNQTQKNLASTGNPIGATSKTANFTPAGSKTTTQTAGLHRTGKLVAEGFSLYRKK